METHGLVIRAMNSQSRYRKFEFPTGRCVMLMSEKISTLPAAPAERGGGLLLALLIHDFLSYFPPAPSRSPAVD